MFQTGFARIPIPFNQTNPGAQLDGFRKDGAQSVTTSAQQEVIVDYKGQLIQLFQRLELKSVRNWCLNLETHIETVVYDSL